MQTQTSNTLHNAIMETGSKDLPPMLAPGNYVQWKSRIKRYIDTKPNHKLIHHYLKNLPYKFAWADKQFLISKGCSETRTKSYMETYKNVSQDIRDQLNADAEAVQIILTGIDNDIYYTVDACAKACEIWKAIKRLKPGESINVQDHKTNLFWEFRKFTSQDGESLESYYSRSQQAATRNRGKAIINSPQRIYDLEPSIVAEDDGTSKNKEIEKLMALISLSGVGYENQRIGNVAGARETVGLTVVSPDAADYGPILDTEQVQKVPTDDDYNVFAIESEHPEQSEFVHDTYPIEQDEHNVIIDSLDISYDREQIDQNDDDTDIVNEHKLLASLIEKLKCEIDESKNSNKFLETSNKKSEAELARHNDVEYPLKVEIDCAKARGDLISYKMESKKSFNKYTQTINDLNQMIFGMKEKLCAHQETISILSQQKEA
nr:hypothetical protein [Tanacetum cinerariifolium]